jgi:outer membrane protein assembly factor BamA
MLICLNNVGVKAEHFKKKPKESILFVRQGDTIDVVAKSVKYLLATGYFKEIVEVKDAIKEDLEDDKDSPHTG